MGFLNDLAGALGKALTHSLESYGDVEHIVEQLKEAPRSQWPHILDAAYERAEARDPSAQNAWSQMFSRRLSDLEDDDPRYKGIHTMALTVFAARAAKLLYRR